MISNDKLTDIIKDCELAGHKVKIKDISYVLLCRCYDDIAVAYKVLFDSDKSNAEILEYHQSNTISFLRTYMDSNFKNNSSSTPNNSKNSKSKTKDITFDENKVAMIELLEKTIQDEKDGLIDPEKSIATQTKLRIALNDKFQVKEEIKEQMVIVNTKYNAICEGCGRETYIPTKEDLMKEYNLIENNN